MKLEDHEREHPLWKKLEAHMEKRLASMRRQNDKDMDHDATVKLRGRIKECNYLLGLARPQEQVAVDDKFDD